MTVRAKFKVDSHDGQNISMTPVSGDSPENKRFYTATPSGKIELYTVNKAAAAQFAKGDEFYVDFVKADKGGQPTDETVQTGQAGQTFAGDKAAG